MTVHLTQLLDDAGQGLALDELHGVMMHAAVAADGVDRDDVVVAQQCRGLGLDLKSLELLGVGHSGEGQYLQRHAAVEGQLHGLVDDAHAAAADLAEQLVVVLVLCSVGQGLLNDIRGIDTGIEALVQAHRDHPPQSPAMADQQLLPRNCFPTKGSFEQFRGVGPGVVHRRGLPSRD